MLKSPRSNNDTSGLGFISTKEGETSKSVEKRILINTLEEKTSEVNRIAHMQLETLNQMMITNHEFFGKDIEITTLKLFNEQLRNDLKREK